MYNKKVFLQFLVKYWILFALVLDLQKPYWTRYRSSNTVSAERIRVQIKSRILQSTVEYPIIFFFSESFTLLET